MHKKVLIGIGSLVTLFLGLLLFVQPQTGSVLAAEDSLTEIGYLPDGTQFTFGVPFETNEFSEDDSVETVVVEEEVFIKSANSNDSSTITPFRIDYGTYISRAYWITRDGVKSISIYPNKNASGWTVAKAWNELKLNFSYYKDWKNEATLKKQFECHARPVYPYTHKVPWNIEPSRTSMNPLTCN